MAGRLLPPKRRTVRSTLPAWAREYTRRLGEAYPRPEDRTMLAIELSRRNVQERTGGPFGAAVFESRGGRLVGIGVNRVESLGLSVAHAEVVALCLAQMRVGDYDLGARGLPSHELVSSAQPCAMCVGAVV